MTPAVPAVVSSRSALPVVTPTCVIGILVLYSILALGLGFLVKEEVLHPLAGPLVFVGIVVVQLLTGPLMMDWMYGWLHSLHWITADELPAHLKSFALGLCAREELPLPRFGIIDDGAPQALTYGHRPANARLVLSRGLLTMLTEDELEAVVAHEIGHARNWDMLFMMMALLVPMVFFELSEAFDRIASKEKRKNKDKASGAATLAMASYAAYKFTRAIMLWISRAREYHADRFAAEATRDPSALARALVKVAFGLTAPGSERQAKQKERRADGLDALNIFERAGALNLVLSAAPAGLAGSPVALDRLKDAMQWDLWNPWACLHELGSTHPLVAKRLMRLNDYATALGQPSFIEFDRARPESYWDEFIADLLVLALPIIGAVGAVAAVSWLNLGAAWDPLWVGAGATLLGIGGLIKTAFMYSRGGDAVDSIAGLMEHVKVSPVRPVPAVLEGTIIGRGVPGLIVCEDLVLQDQTGILLLDYEQPLHLWSLWFGALRARSFQDRRVRVRGWFRRRGVPYLEVAALETLEGPSDGCRSYTYPARLAWDGFLSVAGIALLIQAQNDPTWDGLIETARPLAMWIAAAYFAAIAATGSLLHWLSDGQTTLIPGWMRIVLAMVAVTVPFGWFLGWLWDLRRSRSR